MAGSSIIGALRVVIGADTAALEKGLKDAQTTVGKFTTGLKASADEVLNLRNALVVLAGVALYDFVKKAASAGDEIAKTAQKVGITTDSLQELRYAATLSGTTAADFDAALLQLNKRIGDVNGGVTQAAETLGKLGFSMADIRGQKTDELFKQIADRIGSVRDPMERARIATELFGKAGQQMLPVLTTGAAGLTAMALEAHKFGLVLDAETIKKAEEANDEFTKIGNALKIAGINIAVGFLPALEDLRKQVISQEFQNGVKDLATNFGSLITWLVNHKTELTAAAAAFAGFRLGAAIGTPFGPAVAGILGIGGAIVAAGAAANATAPEIDKLSQSVSTMKEEQDRLLLTLAGAKRVGDKSLIASTTDQLDVLDQKLAIATASLEKLKSAVASAGHGETPASPTQVTITPFNPEVAKAVDDLTLKARMLRGEFSSLSPGFIEAAIGLKVFKDGVVPTDIDISTLSPQLLQLNAAMLTLQGITLTQPTNEFVTLTRAIEASNAALLQGGLNAKQYAALQQSNAQLSETFWLKSGSSIAGSFSQIATSFGTENTKMVSAAKIFAAVSALISTYQGQAQALTLPFPANLAAMAAVGAAGFALVASINSAVVPKMATGGVFDVPGGVGGADKVPISFMAQAGERVHVEPNRYGGSGSEDGGGNVIHVHFGANRPSNDEVRVLLTQIEQISADGRPIKIKIAQ